MPDFEAEDKNNEGGPQSLGLRTTKQTDLSFDFPVSGAESCLVLT
jgi:hypothetical protein